MSWNTRQRHSETVYGGKLRTSNTLLFEDLGNVESLGRSLLRRDSFRSTSINVRRRHVRAGCRLTGTTRDCFKNTAALIDALKRKNVKLAKQLIKQGAYVFIKDPTGRTPLHHSIVTADIELIELIIRNGALLRGSAYENFEVLLLAIRLKNEKVIRLLIDNGIDVNHKDTRMGISVLHWAVAYGNVNAVKILLDAGVEVNPSDRGGSTPFVYCARLANDTEHGLEIAKILLQAGANVNEKNCIDGDTALHEAVNANNEPMVDLLLSRGANVHIKNSYGDTALHSASHFSFEGNRAAIIEKLLDYGSDVNLRNAIKRTPFQSIVSFAEKDIVNLFIRHKPDVTMVDYLGYTALHRAAMNPDKDVMTMVLDMGAIVNLESFLGKTALHFACTEYRPDSVLELLRRGADINAMDYRGRTPLFSSLSHSLEIDMPLPVQERAEDAIEIMLKCGCDLNHRCGNQKQTVLELAVIMSRRNHALKGTGMNIIKTASLEEARTNKAVFDNYNLGVIEGYPEFKSAYERCRNELIAMKNTLVEDTLIPYLHVLTEPIHVVAKYARNKQFLKEYKTTDYIIYRKMIDEKFDAAVLKQEQIDKVTTFLSSTLRFADPSHISLEKIFYYLSEEDVRILIDFCDE